MHHHDKINTYTLWSVQIIRKNVMTREALRILFSSPTLIRHMRVMKNKITQLTLSLSKFSTNMYTLNSGCIIDTQIVRVHVCAVWKKNVVSGKLFVGLFVCLFCVFIFLKTSNSVDCDNKSFEAVAYLDSSESRHEMEVEKKKEIPFYETVK